MICAQSQENTCAAAALFMIECCVKQASMAAGEAGVRKYLGRSEQTWGIGTYLSEAEKVLKSFGCKVRKETVDVTNPKNSGLKFKLGRMSETHPAFVAVKWVEREETGASP